MKKEAADSSEPLLSIHQNTRYHSQEESITIQFNSLIIYALAQRPKRLLHDKYARKKETKHKHKTNVHSLIKPPTVLNRKWRGIC
jgi:hypothetical protein